MAGFFDYLLGREEYASDAPLDPTTGLRPADRRQAALQALGNFSAVLSQVGAARNPAEAAMAWSAMPSAVGAGQTYLDELGKQRRVLQQEQGLRSLMRDPEQLRSLGITDQQMALLKVLPPSVGATMIGKAVNDPYAAETARLNFENLKKQSGQPLTKAVGNLLYMYDENAGKWVLAPGVTAPADKQPTSVQEYLYYKAQVEAVGGTPLPFNEFINQKQKSGASQTTVTVGGEQKPQTKGSIKLDEEFGKDIVDFAKTGGFAGTEKNIQNLTYVINALETQKDISGPKVGWSKANLPESAFSSLYPNAQAAYDRARNVIQQSLKQVLGAQFAAKEAEQLIATSYNMYLPPEENLERMEILRESIKQAGELKRDMLEYWKKNDGTLQGFDIAGKSVLGHLDSLVGMKMGMREDQKRKGLSQIDQENLGLPTIFDDDYSQQRLRAMPSGTYFYDPKGQIRRKP